MSDLKINIIPCLQERKQIAALSSIVETEQNASTIEDDPMKEKIIGDWKNTSTLMNKIWKGDEKYPAGAFLNQINKDGIINQALTVPKFDAKNLTHLNLPAHRFLDACKDLSCTEKWAMYMQYFISNPNKEKENFMLFTHHNRIRGLKKYEDKDALIPFKENADCEAYANNFCLKITIQQNPNKTIEIEFKIIFKGFPDKPEYKYCPISQGYVVPSEDDKKNYLQGINTDQIKAGLKKPLEKFSLQQEKINIYVVRHGNALHNKPVKEKKKKLRLDSPLTPFGMWQAHVLGKIIAKDNPYITTDNVVLCCSFLKRTMLTCLFCLSSILASKKLPKELPNNLKKFMILLTENAIKKYNISILFKRDKQKKISQEFDKSKSFGEIFIDNIEEWPETTKFFDDPVQFRNFFPEPFIQALSNYITPFNIKNYAIDSSITPAAGGKRTRKRKHKKKRKTHKKRHKKRNKTRKYKNRL